MKTLLIGGTGLLGQALATSTHARGWPVVTAARKGADIALDVQDLAALAAVLCDEAPDLVINCAAIVDLACCEADPGLAYRVNARPLAALAEWSRTTEGRLVHVSTDHFFDEDGPVLHLEDAPVQLVNEYSRSKYAAEAFALTAPKALVLRTSIVGIRGWERPTLAEWAIAAVQQNAPLHLFADAWSSSIDVNCFSHAALDLAEAACTGILNVAASEVYTKADFVREVARQLDMPLDHVTVGSVKSLLPQRPRSLGLDVSRAQELLGRPLPGLPEVVEAVMKTYRRRMR